MAIVGERSLEQSWLLNCGPIYFKILKNNRCNTSNVVPHSITFYIKNEFKNNCRYQSGWRTETRGIEMCDRISFHEVNTKVEEGS